MNATAFRIKGLRNRKGRCYELAYRGLMQAANSAKSSAVVVHGEVNGPSDLAPRTGHAWIEYSGDSGFDLLAYDPVKDETMPADEYYRKVKPNHVSRYAPIDAGRMVAKTKHYGPWNVAALKPQDQRHDQA